MKCDDKRNNFYIVRLYSATIFSKTKKNSKNGVVYTSVAGLPSN